MSDLDHFIRWYKNPLSVLYGDDDAGFPILMITFPLLERYLRNLTEADPKTKTFRRALINIFPVLLDDPTAEKFWDIFRHGLLHQATLKNIPRLRFAGVNNAASEIQSERSGFVVSPVKFSRRVISEIEADFTTFKKSATERDALAQIY